MVEQSRSPVRNPGALDRDDREAFMNTVTQTLRGKIQRGTEMGLGIANIGGNQNSFDLLQHWKSVNPPRIGMVVEATLDGAGNLLTLSEVPDTQLAREQAEQAFASTRRQGDALAGGIRKHFGITAFVVEIVLLISFFLLPSVSLAYLGRSLTAWNVLGLDLASFSTNAHGLLSLLCTALFAPMAAPFVRKPWARWLYGAPLGFVLLVVAEVLWQISNAGASIHAASGGLMPDEVVGEIGRQAAGMLHVSLGAYLVLGCSVYLASRILRPIP